MTAGGEIDFRRLGTTTSAAARLAAPEIPLRTRLDLVPGRIVTACDVRAADGVVELRRRDVGGPIWHRPTPALVADWSRDLDLDGPDDDPYGPRLLAAADVAEQVCAQVLALAEAALAPGRTAPTLSAAAALARQLAGPAAARELLVRDGALFWRLIVRDPVHGTVGREMDKPMPGSDRAPAGLLGRRRPDPLVGAEPVTAAAVAAVVRTGGFLGPHAERPDPADVVRELRALAGLSALTGTSAATSWLRRRTGAPTP